MTNPGTVVKPAGVLGVALTVCSLALTNFNSQAADSPSPSERYNWRNATIGGGGFVTGIIFHPRQRGLAYARTDVGGAYRWNGSTEQWVPITDWIGMTDANLTGIESIALDPSDPNRVYLAAGTYSRGNAAILRSDDQGRTFKRSDVSFKMGGNEAGRFNGERLAVDPNLGEILFFGSRQDELWKSTDRGATWRKVESFPKVDPGPTTTTTNARSSFFAFGQQPVGIVSIVFDPSSAKPGRTTPGLYAAVSTVGTNFFRSLDGGDSWEVVAGQPVGLRPNHLVRSPDGSLYLTYGKESGPNTMTDGAVWKFNPKDSACTDITPLKPANADQPFGYGAIAVDAQRPATLMVTTFAHWKPRDEVFRSTDGGATWSSLMQKAEWDHSSAPYTETRTPHWMGDIEINPFNSSQVLFTTGYGIWGCLNVTRADSGRPTRWVFLNNGLEETVPLALISPPEGPHLLSGVGDIDGFRHDDLTVSPAQGSFAGPRYSNTEDMAYAGQKPGVIVRVGTARNPTVRVAMSTDGGRNWEALHSEPPNSNGAGTITLSADGETIVWTPRRGAAHFTTDRGTNWTACVGLPSNLRVVADRVNPAWFYAYDTRGQFLVSTNGAANFTDSGAVLPREENSGGVALSAAPDRAGDLWVAFRNHGLYHSTDAGRTFTRSERVQRADSLGFGKARPGRKVPALFLAGRINSVQALFRSDDSGETWVRINDDAHQFGYISRVTGDPRLFGRVYFATGGRGIVYGDPAVPAISSRTGGRSSASDARRVLSGQQ